MTSTPPSQNLQALSSTYQTLQTDLQTTIAALQKLQSQQQENKSVQQEFSALDPSAPIYKLVGPVLLKQDRSEAVLTVDGRVEFIEKEIKRVEKQITEMQEKSERTRMEVYQLQTQMQQGQK